MFFSRIIDLLSNRVYKKVVILSSALFVAVAAVSAIWIIRYAETRYQEELEDRVAELAVVGASQTERLFLDAVAKQHTTLEQLLSDEYRKIGLAEFRATHIRPEDQDRISDDYVRLLMDRVEDGEEYYRYHTQYDQVPFLIDGAVQVQEPFLKVENIDWAVIIDRKGYAPFHHLANSRPLTGDLETDIIGSRAKRVWHSTGRSQKPNEITYLSYNRESGEPYLMVQAPILLDSQHWGAFIIGYRATEISLAVSKLRRQAAVAILASVILIVIIYSFSINLTLRPLGALHRGVRQLDGGNLDVTLEEGARDEIGYLARALNEMVASIREYSETLENYNAQLIQARDEAEAANRSKTVFLANISHEFRTPLNAISGFSEILSRSITDPTQKSQLAEIEASSRSLVQLVDRVLDYSKSESEQITLTAVPVDVLEFFGELEDRFRERAQSRGLDFSVDLDPEMPRSVTTDPERFRQVLEHLIDNAVKFTAAGHVSVVVRAASREDRGVDLTVDVQDTGVGVPADQHDDIFKPLTQARGQSINEYGGTGMGLALARRIVDAMGGTITVTSQVGVGSTFRVALHGLVVVDDQTIGDVEDTIEETAAVEAEASDSGVELSPEDWADLGPLVKLLEREQEAVSELSKTLSINDVEAFASRVQTEGDRRGYPPLVDWSDRLQGQVAGFDIEGIGDTLRSFDSMVDELRQRVSQHADN